VSGLFADTFQPMPWISRMGREKGRFDSVMLPIRKGHYESVAGVSFVPAQSYDDVPSVQLYPQPLAL